MKKKLIKKAQFGEVLSEMAPIYGTYKSAKRFVEDPSWGKGFETALSLAGDVATFTGLGLVGKGLVAANKARQATKAAKVADIAAQTARTNYWNTAEKLGSKIKHNKNVINSLTLENQPKGYQIISQRIKDNDAYKAAINTARQEDKVASAAMKKAHTQAYNLNNEAAESVKSALLPGLSTVPFQAASAAVSTAN